MIFPSARAIWPTMRADRDDADSTQQRGGHLALARPATSSEELDKWAQQGEFIDRLPKSFPELHGRAKAVYYMQLTMASRRRTKDCKMRTGIPDLEISTS